MQLVEVGQVAHADLEEIVEIAGDDVAVEHDGELLHRFLEGAEALRRRAVEHDADDGERALLDLVRIDLRPDAGDVALGEQALDTAVAGGGAGVHPLGDLGIAHAPVRLQQAQDSEVGPVEFCLHE